MQWNYHSKQIAEGIREIVEIGESVWLVDHEQIDNGLKNMR